MATDRTSTETGPPRPAQADGGEPRDAPHRREELLAGIARDLDERLARIRADVRRAIAAGSEPRQTALEAVHGGVERLAELQQDIAELHGLATGLAKLHRSRTDLAELCARVADAVEPIARERGAEVERELPAFPVTVLADRDRLRHVVEQLAAGVAAATPRRGRVAVRVDPLPGGGHVTIEARPKPSPHSAPAAPAGAVALALCREIVERNGGTLDVGIGRAELRLAQDEAVPAVAPPSPSTGRARILVVEDDDDSREALAEALADHYDVEPAADGAQGVEAARARRPDLVLMDVFLPRLDGFAALDALRHDPVTADVPVILVSGRGDDLTRARSLDLGAIDFLQKPFSERELRARIERTLRLARRQSQLQALADTDALTELANRRAFRNRLAQEVRRARRYGTPLACVMIDMDHLKPVNDRYGHAAGDRAIAAFAAVLRGELRETDFVARYGGDEFVLLLPHTGADEGRALAERICEVVRGTSFDAGGRPERLQASFGVAELPEGAPDEAAEALLRDADTALYAAKAAGRGRVAVHGEG